MQLRARQCKSHVIMSVRGYEHVGCVWSCWETHSNAHTYVRILNSVVEPL